jgi:hypothetical protein
MLEYLCIEEFHSRYITLHYIALHSEPIKMTIGCGICSHASSRFVCACGFMCHYMEQKFK